MHGIANIGARPALAPAQGAVGTNLPSGQSDTGFQVAAATTSVKQVHAQNISGNGSSSLGSQTLSALLQMQDVSQAHGHGGGHGGGHRGGMKGMAGIEAEESAETENAKLVAPRRKLEKKTTASSVSETEETEETEGAEKASGKTRETESSRKEGRAKEKGLS
jgi:hypothetical protein